MISRRLLDLAKAAIAEGASDRAGDRAEHARTELGGDPFDAPDTGADEEEWSSEAPEGAGDAEELRLVAWVASRYPDSELRPHFFFGVEVLYFRRPEDADQWGAVVLLDSEVRRLPLTFEQAERIARPLELDATSRATLETELTWSGLPGPIRRP